MAYIALFEGFFCLLSHFEYFCSHVYSVVVARSKCLMWVMQQRSECHGELHSTWSPWRQSHKRLTALCPGLPRWAGTRKVKTNLDFTEARDSEWQWHQLGHMQVCTLLQTDNHASTPPLSFLQAGCPSCRPTNSVRALKANPDVSHSEKLKHLLITERANIRTTKVERFALKKLFVHCSMLLSFMAFMKLK